MPEETFAERLALAKSRLRAVFGEISDHAPLNGTLNHAMTTAPSLSDEEIDQLRPCGVTVEEYRGWQWLNNGAVPHTARVSMGVSLARLTRIPIVHWKPDVEAREMEIDFLISKGWNPNIFNQEAH